MYVFIITHNVSIFITVWNHETTTIHIFKRVGECRKGVLKLLERFKKKVLKNQVLTSYMIGRIVIGTPTPIMNVIFATTYCMSIFVTYQEKEEKDEKSRQTSVGTRWRWTA